jgi:hypothetical protein
MSIGTNLLPVTGLSGWLSSICQSDWLVAGRLQATSNWMGRFVSGVGILAAVFRSHLTRQMVVQADAHRTVLSKDGGAGGELPFPAAKLEAAFSLMQTVGEL